MRKQLTLYLLVIFCTNSFAQESKFDQLWSDPQIEGRISSGIENNRKGWGMVILEDSSHNPVQNAEILVEQQTHEFLFGANIFMLNGYPTKELNKKYEQAFKKLFNFASVPLYWRDLEPEAGKLRYSKESPFIFRRPPPDAVVAFCRENNITMKGHTLVWDSPSASIPDWAPKNSDSLSILFRKRIESIAERYKDVIRYWDVANEATARNINVTMPHDYVFKAFREAEKDFLPETHLIYNDVPEVFLSENFKEEYSTLYLLLQTLLLRGAKIDGIGLQFHLFEHVCQLKDIFDGKCFSPASVFRVLDTYGQFGIPINISEITFPSMPLGPEGLINQSKLTRNYYRLFFSHPDLEAITWWNVPDGKSWGTEGNLYPGLLDENLNPKPAFLVLDNLINKEWRTNLTLHTGNSSTAKFKGFYGKYKVIVNYNGKTQVKEIDLTKGGSNIFTIQL